AALFCQRCGKPVRRDSAESIYQDLIRRSGDAGDPRLLITFPVPVPANFTIEEVRELLARQGYTRFFDSAAAPAPGNAAPTPPPPPVPPAAAPGQRRSAAARPASLPPLASK